MPPRKAKAAAPVNPFDKGGNRRLHFNILGRRVVGKDKNVAAARAAASTRRDTTLGAEIAASKKANAFMDRRIGEGDAAVDPAAAALARLQKERRRQLGTSAKRARFHLGDDDDGGAGGGRGEELTHLGRSLSDWDAFAGPAGAGRDDVRDDDDEDMEALGADVTAAHFGGGDAGGGGKGPDAPRTHAEIMAEVMAKSKAAKLQRAEEKASQAVLLQRLDMSVPSVTRALAASLVAHPSSSRDDDVQAGGRSAVGGHLPRVVVSSAAAKPFAPLPPSARSNSGGGRSEGAASDDFDSLLHTLATQSRAAIARDRTKTPEEAAAEEAARLAELEALRRARMTADGGGVGSGVERDDDAAVDPALVQFSRAARGVRANVLGGDDLGPDMVEGGALVAKRRQPRALPGASILDLKEKGKNRGRGGVTALCLLAVAEFGLGGGRIAPVVLQAHSSPPPPPPPPGLRVQLPRPSRRVSLAWMRMVMTATRTAVTARVERYAATRRGGRSPTVTTVTSTTTWTQMAARAIVMVTAMRRVRRTATRWAATVTTTATPI